MEEERRGQERCLVLGDKPRRTHRRTFHSVSWPDDVMSAHTHTRTHDLIGEL